jgi:hypothetical protein
MTGATSKRATPIGHTKGQKENPMKRRCAETLVMSSKAISLPLTEFSSFPVTVIKVGRKMFHDST